jgi:hypothetical protein
MTHTHDKICHLGSKYEFIKQFRNPCHRDQCEFSVILSHFNYFADMQPLRHNRTNNVVLIMNNKVL